MEHFCYFSHGLKNVASRYGVEVVFSTPNKVQELCQAVSKKFDKRERKCNCSFKDNQKFTKCRIGVVYRLPLTCGNIYIGQTGRCINICLKEHQHSLGKRKLFALV